MSTMPQTENREVTILLAEDDLGHARLIEKILRRANIANNIVRVTDGQAAVDYLFAEENLKARGQSMPVLVLLDLN
ncbi:MAG TPA: hypothetical protein DCL60_13190, partial [Armatimonadetes bacterium]|nr:hypothetical protein [Armatimonadota bacterium]